MIIGRYFLKSIFSYTLTISFIFVLIIVSSRSIQYLEQAARGEINPEVVFMVVLFRLPEFLELILPLSFFLSIIILLGRYRAEGEFNIMEQLGFNTLRIYSLLLIPVFLISSLIIYSSSFLNPQLDIRVDNLIRAESPQDQFDALKPGEFHRIDSSIVFHFANKKDGILSDVFIKTNNEDQEQIVTATNASLIGKEGEELRLGKGELIYLQDTQSILSVSFDKFVLNDFTIKKPHTIEANFGSGDNYLWTYSLISMIFIGALIAVPLSKISVRQSRYAKVLPSIVIFSLYLAIVLSLKGIDENQLNRLIFLHSTFLVFALFLNILFLRKQR